MKPTIDWMSKSGASHSAGQGRSGRAHLKHYSVTYKEWGEGPPLVLIPGLAGGFELLGPLARRLARDFRVISYQLRGEEDPFALRQSFDMTDLVRDLHELIEWHCLESPIIMGVSFGGALALEYAARYPYHLDQLIVQGVGAKFRAGLFQRIAGEVLSNFPLPTDNLFVNQFFNLLFGGKNRSDELFEFVTRQCWQTDQSVIAHRFGLVEDFNIEARLPRIQAPTLVLSGRKDLLVSPQSLRRLCEGIPDVTHVELPLSGHLGFATQPQRHADEVLRFASEHRCTIWED